MGRIWEHSGLIERDNNDQRAVGALASFFVGGTTTPLAVFSDADESTPHEHPVEADGNGRWPAIFVPFVTSYDVKVTTAGGTQLYYYTELPNPNPVEAAEDTVDPNELTTTGRIWPEMVDEARDYAARLNGRTLGNAASGATERANADTEPLFTYLYNKLANGQAAVSGGRGASASADYAANKTITLPDWRGAIPLGLDDMGNSAASLLGGVTFAHGDAVTPGSLGGANTHVLTTAELASHTHGAGSLDNAAEAAHTHGAGTMVPSAHKLSDNTDPVAPSAGETPILVNATGGTVQVYEAGDFKSFNSHTMSGTSGAGSSHDHVISGSTASAGSGSAHNNVQRSVLVSWYIKL